ncbi:MAG: YidC/Oxa1 family membrane protein insertase [Clostridiaceae bacterium]
MNIIFNGLNEILNYLFSITGDWGIAIILLTVIVRIIILPLSIKQRKSIGQQQILSSKINGIKEKYKNNKDKLELEMKKCYKQGAKSTLGCFISLLQLPLISTLYFVIIKLPVEVGTIIVPWVASIKMTDHLFIIPILYVVINLLPNLIPYISCFKSQRNIKSIKGNMLIMSVFSLFITIKAPIALGIYFITTSLFSLVEEICVGTVQSN